MLGHGTLFNESYERCPMTEFWDKCEGSPEGELGKMVGGLVRVRTDVYQALNINFETH